MSTEAVVHVVDDDVAVRKSLSFLLGSDGLAVRLYETGVALLESSGTGLGGCVVTDVRMPEMDGIELLRQLKQRKVSVPVIVMTGHADVPLAVEAMKQGAVDFIEKPFDDDLLLACIRRALSQEKQTREETSQVAEVRARVAALSEREGQVLDGLVAGKANKVMAYDLGISPRTVEIHRANLMTKMQARSLSELVRMALMVGRSDPS